MIGEIKNIIYDRGFGFIATNEVPGDVFFHRTAIDYDFNYLEEGMSVEFEVEETDKGLNAVNVVLIKTIS